MCLVETTAMMLTNGRLLHVVSLLTAVAAVMTQQYRLWQSQIGLYWVCLVRPAIQDTKHPLLPLLGTKMGYFVNINMELFQMPRAKLCMKGRHSESKKGCKLVSDCLCV